MFLKFTKKNPERFIYCWILQTFIHSWKNQRKRANLNCKWCISLLIEHWQSGMDFNFAGTTASKESTRCVKSMCAGNTKQETFLHGTSLLLSKSCKPCHWSHNLFDRSGIFAHSNNSLKWIILLFSYIKCFLWNNLWNLDKYS